MDEPPPYKEAAPPAYMGPQQGQPYAPQPQGYPQAQPGYPQAQPGYPQAQPGYPQPQPGYPQPQPGYPQAQPGYPQAQPAGAGQPAARPYVGQAPQVVNTNTVIVTGGCPNCGSANISEDYSACGIVLAVLFFPWGLICCMMMKERRCNNCGRTFD